VASGSKGPRIGGAMIAFEVHGDPHEVIAESA
jgi:hypothetical protein